MDNLRLTIATTSAMLLILNGYSYPEFFRSFSDPLPGQWKDWRMYLWVAMIVAPIPALIWSFTTSQP